MFDLVLMPKGEEGLNSFYKEPRRSEEVNKNRVV